MNDDDLTNLYILSFEGIGPKTLLKTRNDIEDNISLIKYFSSKNEKISFSDFRKWSEKFLSNIEKRKISVIKIDSEMYPSNLANINNPPLYLFCQGNLNLLQNNNIFAVVGSRHPTNYGVNITKEITAKLSDIGFIIVSGMAMGIDGLAHKSSIKNGTIAVLGSGLNYIYPATNFYLYKDILENNGLVLSELLPEIRPHPALFPQRSRIIAGLATGLLVTEAADKSGSLIAAQYAFEFGKNVYAVPGDVTRETSLGCNKLISRNIAKLTSGIEDIIEDYNVKDESVISFEDVYSKLSDMSKSIVNTIKSGIIEPDEISKTLNIESSCLLTELSLLEIDGIISREGGEIYLNI